MPPQEPSANPSGREAAARWGSAPNRPPQSPRTPKGITGTEQGRRRSLRFLWGCGGRVKQGGTCRTLRKRSNRRGRGRVLECSTDLRRAITLMAQQHEKRRRRRVGMGGQGGKRGARPRRPTTGAADWGGRLSCGRSFPRSRWGGATSQNRGGHRRRSVTGAAHFPADVA